MKAFLSYSYRDRELYPILQLSWTLHSQGYTIDSSPGYKREMTTNEEALVEASTRTAHLFFALITNTSGDDQAKRIYKEFLYAQSVGIPAILLIEEQYNAADANNPAILFFERNNPQGALDEAIRRQQQALQQIQESMQAQMRLNPSKPVKNLSIGTGASVAWFLGGAAAGLLLGALLSNDRSENLEKPVSSSASGKKSSTKKVSASAKRTKASK